MHESLSDSCTHCYLYDHDQRAHVGTHQSLEYSRVLCNNVLFGQVHNVVNVLSQVHAPIFTAFPTSLTVARGAAASFEATLNAAPATVAWMKDGKEVKEQPMKHRITASGNKVR